MHYILINGRQVEETQAAITTNDRSFRYGDGVFETIAVHDALPYLWESHIQRLKEGLGALKITVNMEGLLSQALALVKANHVTDGLLRMQVSRGQGGRGYMPAAGAPTVVMETIKLSEPPSRPLTLWLSSFEKISPRALPTHCKLAQGLNSTLARMEAAEHSCDEALQLGPGGIIAEASSANVFWRKGAKLYTPSLDCGALAGVTRGRLLQLLPYPIEEGRFALESLTDADALILTHSAAGAMPANLLLPHGYAWDSAALAQEINSLRNKDIKQYGQRLRESLAQM